MTYNPNIPQATDLISNSQPQILANFNQLNVQFGVDHQAFNTGSGNGDGTHKQITFDNAPTEPTPSGTISNIFPLLVGSNQELFFKNASTEYNGAGKVQLTGASVLNTNGYITLPNALIIQWGIGTWTPPGTATQVTINFPLMFPAHAWNVQMIQIGLNFNNILNVTSINQSSFIATRAGGVTSNPQSFYWFAIGN
jgi:hypothetical protein